MARKPKIKGRAKVSGILHGVHGAVMAMAATTHVRMICDPAASTAYTDGKDVFYPPLPDDDVDAIKMIRGMCKHEALHLIHSDFALELVPGLEKSIHMGLEDARIEEAGRERFPGAISDIDALIEMLMSKPNSLFGKPEDGISDVNLIMGYTTTLARCHIRKAKCLEDVVLAYQARLDDRLPGLSVQLAARVFELPSKKDEAETLILARDIVKTIRRYIDDKKKEAEDLQQQAQQQQQQGQGQPQNQAQGAGQPTASDQGQASPGPGASGDTPSSDTQGQDDGSNTPSGGSGHGGGTGDVQGLLDQAKAAAQAAAQAEAALNADAASVMDSDLNQQAGAAIADKVAQAVAEQSYVNAFPSPETDERAPSCAIDPMEALKSSIGVRAKLVNLVEASKRNRVYHVKNGVRIDNSVLSRVAEGDMRIFVRRDLTKAVSTAFHILVDLSGSMSNGKAATAMEAAFSMAKAIEMLPGTSRAVTAFPFGDRVGLPAVLPVVRYGERVARAKDRFVDHPNGSTPMAEALHYVGLQIGQRKEAKKIVVVVTDGDPNNAAAVGNIVERLRKSQIQTYGVGINAFGVKDLFDDHAVIQNVGELSKALGDVLTSNLLAH
ncbi:MAG: VWA domain-containing protein [Rhizobium sp.]|nr:MAG: VWA domain-containing protein [Rhizobium sp.]